MSPGFRKVSHLIDSRTTERHTQIPKNKEANKGVYDEANHGRLQWTWLNDYTYKAKAYTFQAVGKVSQCLGTHLEPSPSRKIKSTHTHAPVTRRKLVICRGTINV